MNVRYIVDDVDRAAEFYTSTFGFQVVRKVPPAFALIKLGDLMIWLTGPGSNAAAPLADGTNPVSGGWNRVILNTNNLDALIARLSSRAAKTRGQPFDTPAGRHILVEDPAGNLIEIVQYRQQAQVTH
ncbi:MAG: VOC family protein [Gemmatimonadota bacterium]